MAWIRASVKRDWQKDREVGKVLLGTGSKPEDKMA